ncbi:hypothetical protein GTP38_23000 [Duganella sp. FT94W]|uniref:Type II toxin-antitoxin system RelE/ParE family toxin n=1 Tax=Duganella lactea TaxID=2692173 RepID=A0ABW9VC42_9BURK|nr:type II toxin-antitoxin system RelE/ParE family toxin [Duganella lactea]MYM37199.1 hypothetical protein [Duganella lactea]
MKVLWTDAAKADVLHIGHYLTQHASKKVAGQITKAIVKEVALLALTEN